MSRLKIKGHEFSAFIVKDSPSRRAVQFRNNILGSLRKIGLSEDDVDVEIDTVAVKKAPACATWYIGGHHLYYSYNGAAKFVENLYVVSKIIELEVEALLKERKTLQNFISEFSEDKDVCDKREEARKVLGVDEDILDLNIINEKYKSLAKTNHPDMPNGNMEKFKEINNAHKILKRELE